MSEKSKFGVIGMGVMGKNLARNFARSVSLSVYNRHVPGIEENVARDAVTQHEELTHAKPFDDLTAFVDSLERPRRILAMIPAGAAVDHLINELLPQLEPGDILMDGGNSHFDETNRRYEMLKEKRIEFLGIGVSGGEKGALHGPAMMPGGSAKGWEQVSGLLEISAAKNRHGDPCCDWIGPAGAGHFVKTIHNGIEYAEMQLLAELYFAMRFGGGLDPTRIGEIFSSWTETDLDSYLLQITSGILEHRENDGWLIDSILDQAGNKGTGKWTTQIVADLGVPATMMPSALWARYLSALKEERVAAEKSFGFKTEQSFDLNVEVLQGAYRLARLVNHHQGFAVLAEASKQWDWGLDLGRIAKVWTSGCIIRSTLMETLAFDNQWNQPLLVAPLFRDAIVNNRGHLLRLVSHSMERGLAVPCLSDAANFLNGYVTANGSANLIQAQRDCFGAHTYRRVDDDQVHHTEWQVG